MHPSSTTTSPQFENIQRRWSDLELAALWATETADKFYFDGHDSPGRVEWFKFVTNPEGKQIKRYLFTIQVDADVMRMCHRLTQQGACIRITPTKIATIRKMAVLLRTSKGNRHPKSQEGK